MLPVVLCAVTARSVSSAVHRVLRTASKTVIACLLGISAAAHGQVVFEGLGTLPGGYWSRATAVSASGNAVVGYAKTSPFGVVTGMMMKHLSAAMRVVSV